MVLREGPAHLAYHGTRIIRLVVVALEQQVSISKQKQFARLLSRSSQKGNQRSRCGAVEEEEGSWEWEANGSRTTCTEMGMGGLTMLGTKAAKSSCFH